MTEPAPVSVGAKVLTDILRRADALVFVDNLDHPGISSDDAHHLRNVLRLAPGATVIAADGRGAFRTCRLAPDTRSGQLNKSRKQPRPNVAPASPTPEESTDLVPDSAIHTLANLTPVTVAFAMVKADRSDWAVQKLTELGIDRISPIMTDRSVIRLDDKGRQSRGERFRRIAREASSQSRRPALPKVDDPITFKEFVDAISSDDLLHTAIAEPGGSEYTSDIRTILIGPEGGWSDTELSCNLRSVDLGPTVLRAETAAIVAGVQLIFHRGSFGS